MRLKFINVLLTLVMSVSLGNNEMAYDKAWNNATDEQRYEMPLEYKAYAVGLSSQEFELFARVVEAECDRGYWDGFTTDGRVYVAVCIWDRVLSDSFPNDVTSVLCQSGQFSTVSNGWCNTRYTDASMWAIVEAQRLIYQNEVPINILYFNCIGYNNGRAYDYIGDNYFMTVGEPRYYIE